jgi:hypothetical protein
MDVRKLLLSKVEGQLGHPHGVLGRGVTIMLNRRNRRSVAAAGQLQRFQRVVR